MNRKQRISEFTQIFWTNLVAFGSLWKVLPLLSGPMINHRLSGLCSPRLSKRSSPKQRGVQYCPPSSLPNRISIFSTNKRSNKYKGLSSWLLFIYSTYAARGQSTVSALNLISLYFSRSAVVDHFWNAGHFRMGSINMNGLLVQSEENSSEERSKSLVIRLRNGILLA